MHESTVKSVSPAALECVPNMMTKVPLVAIYLCPVSGPCPGPGGLDDSNSDFYHEPPNHSFSIWNPNGEPCR
jgi:hypothetical protein